jgi:hypothetical protein
MADATFLREALEHFKRQRSKAAEDLRAIETTISQIQLQLGETPDTPETDTRDNNSGIDAAPIKGAYVPRPDEFFQMSQGDAARAFLEKMGRAVSLDELLNGLRGGGCKVGGADPKRTLYISLVRNTRDFVPVQNGYIGLRKFYANTARPGRPSKTETAKVKRKAKATKKTKSSSKTHKSATPRSSAKPAPETAHHESKAAHEPITKVSTAEIKSALHEILSDDLARTVADLLWELRQRFGHPVKRIAVYGLLRGKDFEADGEKYRNKQKQQQVA